jgi:hypothetical protein
MYFIGDKIKLNYKKEDCPMISDSPDGDKNWDNYVNRQIVSILSPGKFLVKMLWCEREELISIDGIECKI